MIFYLQNEDKRMNFCTRFSGHQFFFWSPVFEKDYNVDLALRLYSLNDRQRAQGRLTSGSSRAGLLQAFLRQERHNPSQG